MRMAVKDDAEHVPYLTLVPISGGPDIGDGGHARSFEERNLETDVRITLERQQVIDDGEIGLLAGRRDERAYARRWQ